MSDDPVVKYIEAFQLEEGDTLTCKHISKPRQEIYWGVWGGRKLFYILWEYGDDMARVAFSLDFAQYEVAAFCRRLEEQVGSWEALNDYFLSVVDGEGERILWGADASLYRTFRDAGRIGDDTH